MTNYIINVNTKQLTLFLLLGGIAAAINFSTRIFLNHWMSFSASVFFAYLVGMAAAYFLFKIFVFKNNQKLKRASFFYFTLVNLLGIAQTWVVSMALAYYILPIFGVSSGVSEAAHIIGIAVPAFTSYFGHKYWSFK